MITKGKIPRMVTNKKFKSPVVNIEPGNEMICSNLRMRPDYKTGTKKMLPCGNVLAKATLASGSVIEFKCRSCKKLARFKVM